MVAVVDRYNLVKALHSLLYARLWSAMFSGGTQHVLSRYQNKKNIQGGRGSAPFTETAYSVKYFKPIPKEINQDASTVWT